MELADVTDEFIRSIDLHTVLPQQDPFVMVGRLTRFSLTSSSTETLIEEKCLFAENGYLSPTGILENIAQTCAARIGFYNKYILEKDVQVGFIGAIRDCRINGKVKVGQIISTTVEVIEEIFGMTLANAHVSCGDEEILTTQIKLAVKDTGAMDNNF